MRLIAMLVLVLLAGILTVDARMPGVGDYVRIYTPIAVFDGNITAQDGLWLTLNCTVAGGWNTIEADVNEDAVQRFDPPKEMYIGMNQIIFMAWPNS